MQKAISYAPYVYACRTSQANSTTFHLFVLIPIPKSKSVHFISQPTSGAKRSVRIEKNTLEINLEVKRSNSEFGNKFVSKNQTFWAGYISFNYAGTENIPDPYEYAINIHKNKDGQPDKTIKVLYGDIESLSQIEFNELKDGDFALACPYAYLYQEEKKGQTHFFPQILISEIEKSSDSKPFDFNKKEDDTMLILPSSMVTSENITVQIIKNSSLVEHSEAAFRELSASIDSNTNSLTVDYTPKEEDSQLLSRSPRQRKKKKMKVRTKGAGM